MNQTMMLQRRGSNMKWRGNNEESKKRNKKEGKIVLLHVNAWDV